MKSEPPPIAVTPPAVPPVSPPKKTNGGDINSPRYITESVSPEQQRDKRRSANRMALAFVGLLVGMVAFATYLQERASKEPMPIYPTPPPNDDGLSNLTLTFTWSKAGFDSIMKANFQISNRNDFAVKDIEVRCTYAGSSGTQIDSNTKTIYEVVPANSLKAIPDFSMGFINSQVSSAGCRAISVKRAY